MRKRRFQPGWFFPGDKIFRDLQFIFEAGLTALVVAALMGWWVVDSILPIRTWPEALGVSSKAAVLSFTIVFGCLTLFLASMRLLMPTLRSWGQRLGAAILFWLFLSCNYIVFISESSEGSADGSWLSVFVKHPALALSMRFLLIFLLTIPLIFRFIQFGKPGMARFGRTILPFGIVMALLVGDYIWSEHQRRIHPDNRTTQNHEILLFIPHLDRVSLERVLDRPSLARWAETLDTIADIVPGSSGILPQALTVLTKSQPWQHGVRSDGIDRSAADNLHKFLMGKLVDETNKQVFLSAPGVATGAAAVFSRSPECAGPRLDLLASVLEPLFSQIPPQLMLKLFPELTCSQQLMPLKDLIRNDLREVTAWLRKPQGLFGVWWIEPVWHFSHEAARDRQQWENRLAEVLHTFEDSLQILGLTEHTRIAIIGINPGSPGVLAFSPPPGTSVRELVIEEKLRTEMSQIRPLLHGELPSPNAISYSEVLQSTQSIDQPTEARTVFSTERIFWCRWDSGVERRGLRVIFRPSATGIETEIHAGERDKVIAPITPSRDACLALILKQFGQVVDADIGFEGRKPLRFLARGLTDRVLQASLEAEGRK